MIPGSPAASRFLRERRLLGGDQLKGAKFVVEQHLPEQGGWRTHSWEFGID